MIINDLDGYYIVFDTKNWNTELDTLFINLKNQMKMKRETLKKILNFVITVLTAVASAFCVQSCQ